jgi:large subunit ribosomal protein L17
MRHQRAGVHLSRTSAHRKALFSNLIAALFYNERIRTTDAKAKETRRLAERTITWARRVGDALEKAPEKRSLEESSRVVHSIRMARRVVRDRGAVLKLFDELRPRYQGRHGGYTRIVKLGQRPGDAAPMSLLELIPEDSSAAPKGPKGDEGGEKSAKGKASKGEAAAKGSAKAPKAEAKPAKGGGKPGGAARPSKSSKDAGKDQSRKHRPGNKG